MMQCYKCGGTYQKKSDLLEVIDPYVGTIAIQGVPYYTCDKCDDILYTEEMSRAIEAERNRLLHETLKRFPMDDFITAAETASILGISRQALHKNRRIKHGFIYQTIFGAVIIYLRQSVLQFKKTGDGRFPLYLHEYNPSAQYVEDTVPMKLVSIYNPHTASAKSLQSPFRKSYTSLLEENSYAN